MNTENTPLCQVRQLLWVMVYYNLATDGVPQWKTTNVVLKSKTTDGVPLWKTTDLVLQSKATDGVPQWKLPM